jgi:transposase-like protein
MTERAAPFHCPYCGDEDLRPFGDGHGDWRCGACTRAFRLRYLGLTRGSDAAQHGIELQTSTAETGEGTRP